MFDFFSGLSIFSIFSIGFSTLMSFTSTIFIFFYDIFGSSSLVSSESLVLLIFLSEEPLIKSLIYGL